MDNGLIFISDDKLVSSLLITGWEKWTYITSRALKKCLASYMKFKFKMK